MNINIFLEENPDDGLYSIIIKTISVKADPIKPEYWDLTLMVQKSVEQSTNQPFNL